MHQQHRHAEQPAQQCERIQQAEEAALIEGPQLVAQPEGDALQHVADGHAEHQRRYEAADEQRPVPGRAPARILPLRAVLEGDRPQDQCRQDQEHGDVETGEADGVERWPGGKDRAAPQNEPDLVAFPHRGDGVDGDPPLHVGAGGEGQQRAHAHIETVGDGEADQQHAQQHPPGQLQRIVVDEFVKDHDRYSAGAGTGEVVGRRCMPSASSGPSGCGPLRMYFTINATSTTASTV